VDSSGRVIVKLRRGRGHIRRIAAIVALLAGCLLAAPGAGAQIVTYAGNNLRDSLYQTMHKLTPKALTAGKFRQIWKTILPDGGQVYTQPLLADGRLIVATEKNDIYELDPSTGRIIASRKLGGLWSPRWRASAGFITCTDTYPYVGVTSTPVIDTAADGGAGVIYLTAKTPLPASPTNPIGPVPEDNAAQYLMYALNLQTLQNVPSFNAGQALQLSGTKPGTNPLVTFDATYQLQRPGLLELGGNIYAAFGSECDLSPYRGWVIGVNATTGQETGTFVDETEAGARGGGIWMGGAGLMSDGPGRIFFASGNGFDAPNASAQHTPAVPAPGSDPPSGLAESVVRLQVGPSGALSAADFFAPCLDPSYAYPRNLNVGLNSGGVTGLPRSFGNARDPDLLFVGGKSGQDFLLNRNKLGGFSQGKRTKVCPKGGDAAAQALPLTGGVWGSAGVWPGLGGWLYASELSAKPGPDATIGDLQYYHGHLGTLKLTASTGLIMGSGSAHPIVTSVGANASTGIVWVVTRPVDGITGGTLRAYYLTPKHGHPVQIKSWKLGVIAKFDPPGIGPDQLYLGGADDVIRFGVR